MRWTDSPAAVDRIDAVANRSVPPPPAFLAKTVVTSALGVRYAAWADRRYGDDDIVLSWQFGDGSWVRPRLVPRFARVLDRHGVVPVWEGDELAVNAGGQSPGRVRRLDLAQIVRDFVYWRIDVRTATDAIVTVETATGGHGGLMRLSPAPGRTLASGGGEPDVDHLNQGPRPCESDAVQSPRAGERLLRAAP